MHNGQRISQSMVFPQNHLKHPGEPKGMKQILKERSLWRNGLLLICKNKKNQDPKLDGKCDPEETIEAAGHLCIFLPKFQCELNFIEFFWGAVKKYLQEHCDYTYDGLRANIPKALKSVQLSTIRKWEHRMIRWMEAYREGKGAKEAQIQVKKFSSRAQSSHLRIPEYVAQAFD